MPRIIRDHRSRLGLRVKSWIEMILGGKEIFVALVSAIAGGVLVFLSNAIAPSISGRLAERRELSRTFRSHAAPIGYASYQLYRRIRNIIDDGNFAALSESWQSKPHWPMTREYFTESTQYLFGAFFCTVQLYLNEARRYTSPPEKVQGELNRCIREAQRALYDVSLNTGAKRDHQIYLLEQQAMAEALLDGKDTKEVMGFYEFRRRLRNDNEFADAFSPSSKLLLNLSISDDDFRHVRLGVFAKRLAMMHEHLAANIHGDVYALYSKVAQSRRIGQLDRHDSQ